MDSTAHSVHASSEQIVRLRFGGKISPRKISPRTEEEEARWKVRHAEVADLAEDKIDST